MANETKGAVHLTSLDLDLTQFNENIRQIEEGTAQAAETAVRMAEQIKQAFNMPTETVGMSLNTEEFNRNIGVAKDSLQNLGDTYRTITKEFQGKKLLSAENFEDIAKALKLSKDEAEQTTKKLEKLINSLSEYDKVSISASSSGKLMQAVIESTDKAGIKIRKVIDLTKELDENFLSSSTTITDNAEKRNVAIEKTNNSLANSLDGIISKYDKLARQIEKSDLSDLVKEDFIQEITSAENGIKGLQQEIRSMNQAVDKTEFKARFNEFNINLESISDSFNKAKQTQKEFLADADKQIGKISNQYENLASKIEKSDLSNLVKEDLLNRINQAQTSMQNLANNIAEVSSVAQKGDYDKEFADISFELKNITTEFDKATQSQKDFITSGKLAKELSKDYAQLQNRLAGLIYSMTTSKINTPEMEDTITKAKNYAKEMAEVAESVRNSDVATEGAQFTYNNFVDTVSRLELALKKAKTSSAEFKNALEPIKTGAEGAVASLRTLEKAAVFKSSKKNVAELRLEYEEFLTALKNGTITSVDEAKKKFDELSTKFDDLEASTLRSSGAMENFVNKISESAKWQIANSALNLLQQAFGNLVGTITTTEDSVIELRRVLNDSSVTDSAMQQELYNIAYEFGQTFDNVQEVAVKFAQTGKSWQETIDATRATMLGLNTAELEVTTATEGLIATMAQFNIDASDLEAVIDKVNITADNFPVTSEKIVAALQRAGGTAHAFNMTLEETIATITALAEKTGRSGENIGTALNSLIIFTNKSENLELFSGLSEQMDDVVKKFQAGSASVIDIWKQLNNEIQNLTKQQEAALFDSTAYEEFASQFEAEAAEYAGTIQDIYGTAGAYRRNYLTVLLQDMSTVEDVMGNLTGAIGYSMQENETAMESFSKKWNQLIVAAQELAVQFGNSGFLDLMKGATEAATAILKLTKNIGGLNTLLLATSTLFFGIKRQKINEYLEKQNTVLAISRNAFKVYTAAVRDGKTQTEAFGAAVKTVQLSAGGWVTAITAIATVVFSVASAFQEAKKRAAEFRQEQIQEGKEAVKSAEDLAVAYEKYNKARESGTKEEISDSSLELLKILGYTEEGAKNLVAQYMKLENGAEALDEEIKKLVEDLYNLYKQDAFEWAENAREDIKDLSIDIRDFDDSIKEALLPLMYQEGVDMSDMIFFRPDTVEDVNRFIEILTTRLNTLKNSREATTDAGQKEIRMLEAAIAEYSKYTEEVSNADEANERLGGSIFDLTKSMMEGIEGWNEWIEKAAGVSNVKVSVEDLTASIEELQKQFDTLSKKVDGFQSAYQTVQKVIKEYNETGVMSADMLQTIMGLEPEYIEMLNIQGDSLSLNEQKVHELMQANEDYLVQLEALRIAEQIQNMMLEIGEKTTEDMTEAQIAQKIASQQLSGSLEQAILSFMKGETTADQLDATLRNIAASSGLAGNQINFLSGEVANLTGKMVGLNQIARITQLENTSQLERRPGESDEAYEVRLAAQERQRQKQRMEDDISALKGLWSTTSSGGGSSKASSTNKETDALKAQKKALDDLLDSYEHQIYMLDRQGNKEMEIVDVYKRAQEAMHEQAENYRAMGTKEADKYADELSEKWWEYQDKIEDVLSGIYDATINSHENALKLLDEQFTFYEKRNDYSKMSKNLEKQLDYQTKIQQEAHKEAERLRALNVDENDEAVQACIDAWWKADDAIQKINQQIEESILGTYDDFIDMADEFDLWEYMDFSKVDYLREKLAEINRLLENGTISLKEYNVQLKEWNSDMFAAQKERFSAQQDEIKKRSDDTVKRYKAEIDALKDQKTATSDYYDSVVDGYQAEIDAYDKRKDEVEDYYDTLLKNLNEVEAANERINAQMDYYNERQKIMTNLEQAQSRSGLEWREKEMEYQQQLNNLDENWRRQQQDWQIEDQTAALEKMREKTIAEIDLSIDKIKEAIEAAKQAKDAALDGIEAQISGIEELISATEDQAQAEIDAIEEQIKDLSRIIAESIKNGVTDGFVDTQAEVDTAVTNTTEKLLAASADTNQQISNSANETSNSVFGFYEKNFISPLNREIEKIANYMESEIPTSASIAAQSAFQVFSNLMFSPLKTAMSKLMSQTQAAKESVGLSTGTTVRPSSVNTGTTSSVLAPISAALRGNPNVSGTPYSGFATNNNVFINNYNQSQDESVRRSQTILQKFLGR